MYFMGCYQHAHVKKFAHPRCGAPGFGTAGQGQSQPTYETLPPNLPVPEDDGLAAHLLGRELPSVSLDSSGDRSIPLSDASRDRWVLFIYPTTGVPGEDMPNGWDEIPGARGCTPEACGFRDNLATLREAGATEIYGLSTQPTAYQIELVTRLHLPYPLLTDPDLQLQGELDFPTFEVDGARYYKRITLVNSGKRSSTSSTRSSRPTNTRARCLPGYVRTLVNPDGCHARLRSPVDVLAQQLR